MRFRITCILFLSLFLIACEKREKTVWVTHTEPDRFVIKVPSYMESDSTMNGNACMNFRNDEKGLYIVVLYEDHSMLEDLGYELNIEGYQDLIKQNMDTSGHIRYYPTYKAEVNGMQALEYKFEQEGTYDLSSEIFYTKGKEVIINGEKSFYQLFMYCRRTEFWQNEAIFNSVIRSFYEL